MATTLEAGSSLRRVAYILQCASLFGSQSWSDRQPSRTNQPLPSSFPDLTQTVLELFRLLKEREVRYLLVGGVALLRYLEGRNTEDIDLLMSVQSMQSLPEIQIQEHNPAMAKGDFRGLRVDFLLTTNPFFQLILDRYATSHRFLEMDIPCATAEGLVLLKLFALPSLYQQGDFQRINLYEADIAGLIAGQSPNIEALFAELQPYVHPGQLHELRRIVAEIQQRIQRVRQSSENS